MNLLLLQPEDLGADSNHVTLNDARATHIRTVLRAAIGDSLKIGLLNALTGNATLPAMSDNGLNLEF